MNKSWSRVLYDYVCVDLVLNDALGIRLIRGINQKCDLLNRSKQ